MGKGVCEHFENPALVGGVMMFGNRDRGKEKKAIFNFLSFLH